MIRENISVIRWMSGIIGWKKIYIILLLVLQASLGIAGVVYAVLLKNAVDQAVAGHGREFVKAIALFAVLVAVQIMIRAVSRFLEEYSRASMENRFKKRLFGYLLRGDYGYVSTVHSGEWMNRLTSDTIIVADGLTQILPGTVGMLVKLLGALLMLLILEPVFAVILIPGGVLVLLLTYGFRKVLKKLHKNVQEADGRLRILLQESLTSMLVVRAFVRENQTGQEAERRMENHRNARMKRNHFSNICNVGFGSIMQGMYVAATAVCGYGILTKTISYGTFMAVLQLIGQIQSPFANVTGYLPRYYAMLASAERLQGAEREVLSDDLDECRSEEEIRKFYRENFQSVDMKHLSFTYRPPVPEAEPGAGYETGSMPVVLKDLNLQIHKGEYIAFTGPSGCGKSTVLKLLLCLYQPECGTIELSRNSGRPVKLDATFRRMFAYVPQGNHLLSGTIREIVTFSDAEQMQCDEKIWKALDIACARKFVESLTSGLDTRLGEKGMGLSEGQMQRLAIARAVFLDNPILMLDEATSALDEKTERLLLERLRTMTDKTVIIITHRPAALSICDREIRYSTIGTDGREPFSRSESVIP